MTLVCIKAFGSLIPGDEVEVPENSKFDTGHFRAKPQPVVEAPGIDEGDSTPEIEENNE